MNVHTQIYRRFVRDFQAGNMRQSSTFDLTSLWVAGSPDEEQEHTADDERRADDTGC